MLYLLSPIQVSDGRTNRSNRCDSKFPKFSEPKIIEKVRGVARAGLTVVRLRLARFNARLTIAAVLAA
jgi:hypothetical protein